MNGLIIPLDEVKCAHCGEPRKLYFLHIPEIRKCNKCGQYSKFILTPEKIYTYKYTFKCR